jgi:gliding motility-associated-like protein
LDIPIISLLSEWTYNVSIIDANECAYEFTPIYLTDVDEDCIRIPNAFTPNDDGINDTWIIENISVFPNAIIQVFNRWGQEIWTAKSNEEPWNGKFNDKSVPTGTYIYVIILHNGLDTYTGTVTVVY